jgi:hypothetical protein
MKTLDIPPIKTLAEEMLAMPQVECPLAHFFAPGVYIREIFMPKGTMVIGQVHKTEHFNIILEGRARVIIDGEVHELSAPCTFVSKAGCSKVLNVLEDCRWQTVHLNPDNLTDVDALEALLVRKPEIEMESK